MLSVIPDNMQTFNPACKARFAIASIYKLGIDIQTSQTRLTKAINDTSWIAINE